MRTAAIVLAAMALLAHAPPAEAMYDDYDCTFDWGTNTVTCLYIGQPVEEFCEQNPVHEICSFALDQSVSQNNVEAEDESDERPSGSVDEGEQEPPTENEPELTEDVNQAVRDFRACVAATRRSVDTSEFDRTTIAFDTIEKANLANIVTRYNHHPVHTVYVHVVTYDRDRILQEARSHGVPARQVFAFASFHEHRHADDAKRCASHVNLKGIDFDCQELETSAYIRSKNIRGLSYEEWTDQRAAEDYFAAFGTPAYRGDPLRREYASDGHPECMQD